MAAKDRRSVLIASSQFNGIDFIEVVNQAQTQLKVHFFNAVSVAGTLTATPLIAGGETIASVAVHPVSAADWGFDDGHETLLLAVTAPGDFSNYQLTLQSPILDPFYSSATFSFKAGCPSDLDCEPPPVVCPPPSGDAPPIDYLAKDFLSFRQALLDFSALRYPNWQERSEADFGVMFLEALSALADDLSYMQDRVAAEGTLPTATQRRSVVRHARLVDYEPQPLLAATVTLQFDVGPNCDAIPYGTTVSARDPSGERIVYETGSSLAARMLDPKSKDAASSLWNRGQIEPYWYDDSQWCLGQGSTSMSVLGHGFRFLPGQALLIETDAPDPADPPVRQIVHLLPANDPQGQWAVESCDPLFLRLPGAPGGAVLVCSESPPPAGASPAMMPTAVTLLRWQATDALDVARDLRCTRVVGNLVNATQGVTIQREAFTVTPGGVTAPVGDFAPPSTVVRTSSADASGSAPPLHLYTLQHAPLAWLTVPGCSDPGIGSGAGLPFNTPSQPEIVLTSLDAANAPQVWSWSSTLLAAGQFQTAYALEDARYTRIVRNSDQTPQYDYDGDGASSIRFGNGVFGANPEEGAPFVATYRVALGARGNVAADSITELDPASKLDILAVTNPFAAQGGADAQSLDSVRMQAPAAFRAVQFRAVLPDDYVAAAETQSWVQRAGCVFRWTGSWLTVFTTPDPEGSESIAIEDRLGLVELLNRYRLAGYESYVPDPQYISVDLLVEVCALPSAFRGDVEAGLLQALSTGGFFAADNFSFGQPLERSRLESAIRAVPGVDGVLCIEVRVRGRSLLFQSMADQVTVGVDQIIRCDNDPSRPERGSIKLVVLGGK